MATKRKTQDIYLVFDYHGGHKYCLTPESAADAVMMKLPKADRLMLSKEGLVTVLSALKINGAEKRLINHIGVTKRRAK